MDNDATQTSISEKDYQHGVAIGKLEQSVKALCGSVDQLRGEVEKLRSNVATKDDIRGFYEHCSKCRDQLDAADEVAREAQAAADMVVAEAGLIKRVVEWAAPYIVPGAISALTALVVVMVES